MPAPGGVTGLVDVGMGVQTHEVVTLVLLLAGLVPVIIAARRSGARWFFLAYTAMVGGGVATVAESIVAPQLLNMAEHILTLTAAFLFLFSAYWSHAKVTEHPHHWQQVLEKPFDWREIL